MNHRERLTAGVFSLCLASIFYSMMSHKAFAGSVSGQVDVGFQDLCANPTVGTGQCSAAVSSQYLERCLANFEGLQGSAFWNPSTCTSGQCQGWKITSRSKVLVTDDVASPDYLGTPIASNPTFQASYCTNRRLHIVSDLPVYNAVTATAPSPFAHLCQDSAGRISTLRQSAAGGYTPVVAPSVIMKPANINSIPLPAYTDNSIPTTPVQRKVSYRRVYIRAADPDGIFQTPHDLVKRNYLYSLSLKDAICTWRKFCNPTSRGLKPGVPTTGEALLPGSTSFEPDHPIARLCQLDPKWHMSNAAVACVLSQPGGINTLCATPDPLEKNPALGLP